IIVVNSCAMSTFDCSSALPTSVPRPPVPATPTLGKPAESVVPYRFAPIFSKPFALLKFARASCATATDCPAPKVATIEPSGAMLIKLIKPGAEPFCPIDDVADAESNPVSVGLLLASRMAQLRLLTAAPSFHVGVTIDTLAGAAPSTVSSLPDGLN